MSEQEGQSTVLQTAAFDARFPNTNQSKHCSSTFGDPCLCKQFQSYVDYYRCIDAKGEDFPACKTFWRTYHSLCPNEWIAKWDEQREENKFPAKLTA